MKFFVMSIGHCKKYFAITGNIYIYIYNYKFNGCVSNDPGKKGNKLVPDIKFRNL